MKILRAHVMNVAIVDCPRCGQAHDNMTNVLFFKEPTAGGFTHFVECPMLRQPILLRLLGETDK